jgi:hypothetical protein
LANENPAAVFRSINPDLSIVPPQQPVLDPEAELLASFRPDLTLAEILNVTSEPMQKGTLAFDIAVFDDNSTTINTVSPPSNKSTLSDDAKDKSKDNAKVTVISQAVQPRQTSLNLEQFVCSFEVIILAP